LQLYNKLSSQENSEIIDKSNQTRFVVSFYKYHLIKNPIIFRNFIFIILNNLDILGRVYVSGEGINAQISVPKENYNKFKIELEDISFLQGIRLNLAREHFNKSFLKLKIKIRKKIVSDGLKENQIKLNIKGTYISAKEMNNHIKNKNSVILDVRNHYESEIGHFKNAITPNVDTFRESLPLILNKMKNNKNKNIVMYCTGGIRCEKASAMMKSKGFKNIFHLEGGIIEYAKQVKDQNLENLFLGSNFVFDERRAEKISNHIISNCHQCDKPFEKHTNCANVSCNLLFIQCDSCKSKYNNCCSNKCMDINLLPLNEQKKNRKGKNNTNKIFNKSRINNFNVILR